MYLSVRDATYAIVNYAMCLTLKVVGVPFAPTTSASVHRAPAHSDARNATHAPALPPPMPLAFTIDEYGSCYWSNVLMVLGPRLLNWPRRVLYPEMSQLRGVGIRVLPLLLQHRQGYGTNYDTWMDHRYVQNPGTSLLGRRPNLDHLLEQVGTQGGVPYVVKGIGICCSRIY